MERRGRDEVDVIARETSNETGKTEEEVRRYHTVFWARHKELADWERIIDKIEKGEKRLQRSKEIREALAEKIARFVDCVEAIASPATPSTRRLGTSSARSRMVCVNKGLTGRFHAGLRSRTSASR